MRTIPVQLLISLMAASAAVVTLPAPAHAQTSPITLVGYFDRAPGDHPQVTDEIKLSIDGKAERPFGLVRVQSQNGVGGTDVFRHSMNPVTLVRGPQQMTAKLDAAGPTQQVKIIGMFDLRSNNIVATGVEVAKPPPTSGTGAAPAQSGAGKE